jgi:glucan endo-1,3-alpha-glucosidase
VSQNIGSSEWQRQRIADTYDVARTIGTNFKFFISFDFTEMGCDLNDIVSRTRTFSDHPNQFKINGKPFVSSYAGDCLGNGGWASFKAHTNAYIMPFIWGLEGQFNSWTALDSWYWCVSSLFEVWDGF